MAKRRARKKSSKKKAPARKAARKSPARKAPRRRTAARKPAITGLVIQVPPELDARLKMLATNMAKTMEELIAQALAEFTETWEEHLRTIAALKDDEDRVHLSVPKE
jgi:predicted transcriptional regulator